MSANDAIQVSVEVPLSQAQAFDLFTRRIDAWWQRGPRHRFRSPWTNGVLEFVPGPNGCLVERYPDAIVEIGRITSWQPPHRFSMSWRLPIFSAHESTQVDVEFQPLDTGCRVQVSHSGWTTLRPDHPARHGLEDADFLAMHGGSWVVVLNSLRSLALHETSSAR